LRYDEFLVAGRLDDTCKVMGQRDEKRLTILVITNAGSKSISIIWIS
jgi:hypothetical protein